LQQVSRRNFCRGRRPLPVRAGSPTLLPYSGTGITLQSDGIVTRAPCFRSTAEAERSEPLAVDQSKGARLPAPDQAGTNGALGTGAPRRPPHDAPMRDRGHRDFDPSRLDTDVDVDRFRVGNSVRGLGGAQVRGAQFIADDSALLRQPAPHHH